MSNSNGQIKAPVNIAADLGYVLGTGSGDLGYNIANGNINKWAVYKPVRNSAIGWVSPRNTLASLGFGDTLPRASTINALINYYSQTDNGWAYLRPRGKAQNEYYRAADFCKIVGSGGLDTSNYGYTHYARNPFGANFSALPAVVSKNGDQLFVQQGRITPSGDYPDNEIAIYDFNQLLSNSLKMKYYGCVIKGYSGSASSVAARLFGSDTDFTSAARGKEELNFTLTINSSKFQTLGGYIVYPCISNYALSDNGTTMTSGQYLYPIPGATPAIFEVIEDYIVIVPYATVQPYTSGSSYNVQWSFQITNYHDFDITLTDVGARFRLPGKVYQNTMEAGEVPVDIGTVNIAAGATYYYPGQGLSAMQNLTNFNLSQLIVGAMYNNQLKQTARTFIAPAPNI